MSGRACARNIEGDGTRGKAAPVRKPSERRPYDGPPLGRTGTWLRKWFGMAAIVAGFAFAMAGLLVPTTLEWIVWRYEIGIAAAGLLGVGVGWQARDERGRRF